MYSTFGSALYIVSLCNFYRRKGDTIPFTLVEGGGGGEGGEGGEETVTFLSTHETDLACTIVHNIPPPPHPLVLVHSWALRILWFFG